MRLSLLLDEFSAAERGDCRAFVPLASTRARTKASNPFVDVCEVSPQVNAERDSTDPWNMIWFAAALAVILANILVLAFLRAGSLHESALDVASAIDHISERWWRELDRLERVGS
jgi:hypothetical protein